MSPSTHPALIANRRNRRRHVQKNGVAHLDVAALFPQNGAGGPKILFYIVHGGVSRDQPGTGPLLPAFSRGEAVSI